MLYTRIIIMILSQLRPNLCVETFGACALRAHNEIVTTAILWEAGTNNVKTISCELKRSNRRAICSLAAKNRLILQVQIWSSALHA